jgi:dTMP kinase
MGLLISVEGGEFTGKTTLIKSLYKLLQKAGINVHTAQDPGGTFEGEKIRKYIFKKLPNDGNQLEIAKLFFKSRGFLIKEVLTPILGLQKDKDAVVILDRYIDSTRVYQGFEGGLDLTKIRDLEQKYIGDFYPDLTLILFFPVVIFEETLKKGKKKISIARKILIGIIQM